jgi:hypothetical protein
VGVAQLLEKRLAHQGLRSIWPQHASNGYGSFATGVQGGVASGGGQRARARPTARPPASNNLRLATKLPLPTNTAEWVKTCCQYVVLI